SDGAGLSVNHRQAGDAELVSHRVRDEMGAVVIVVVGEAVRADLADWLSEISVELRQRDHVILASATAMTATDEPRLDMVPRGVFESRRPRIEGCLLYE